MEPDTKSEINKEQAKAIFKKLLDENGWMRDPDGEDHCGSCFAAYPKHLGELPINPVPAVDPLLSSIPGLRNRRRPDGKFILRPLNKNYVEELIESFKADSSPTSLIADVAPNTVSVREGWYAHCEGPGGKNPATQGPARCPTQANIFVSADGKTIEVNKE